MPRAVITKIIRATNRRLRKEHTTYQFTFTLGLEELGVSDWDEAFCESNLQRSMDIAMKAIAEVVANFFGTKTENISCEFQEELFGESSLCWIRAVIRGRGVVFKSASLTWIKGEICLHLSDPESSVGCR